MQKKKLTLKKKKILKPESESAVPVPAKQIDLPGKDIDSFINDADFNSEPGQPIESFPWEDALNRPEYDPEELKQFQTIFLPHEYILKFNWLFEKIRIERQNAPKKRDRTAKKQVVIREFIAVGIDAEIKKRVDDENS
jgi:hypothetical protein